MAAEFRRARTWLRRTGILICIIAVGSALWFLVPVLIDYAMTKAVVIHHPDGSRWKVYRVKRWGEHVGKAHGEYRAYHSGEPWLSVSGHKRNGEWNGVLTFWDPDGRRVRQKRYENGELLEVRTEPPWWDSLW